MKDLIINKESTERTVLVGLITSSQNEAKVNEYLDELEFLADTAGAVTVRRFTQKMDMPNSRTFVGKGKLEDLDFLEDLGKKIKAGSLCGLGQTAPNPVLATLRYYRHEYEAHVKDHVCEALQCNALVKLTLDQSKCVKCRMCIKNCPVNAISDDFVIDADKCTRCNSCMEVCPKKAISRISE